MAKKSSDKRIIIKMVSTGKKKDSQEKTGYYLTTTKNKSNTTAKLELKKFDPRAYNPETGKFGMHVIFKEEKIK